MRDLLSVEYLSMFTLQLQWLNFHYYIDLEVLLILIFHQ